MQGDHSRKNGSDWVVETLTVYVALLYKMRWGMGDGEQIKQAE